MDYHFIPDSKKIICGYSITDSETKCTINNIHSQYSYIIDPHTAVAFAAFLKDKCNKPAVILSTAHPIKFKSHLAIEIPKQIQTLFNKSISKYTISPNYNEWKISFLLNTVNIN